MASAATQQINVSDLSVEQLSDVRRQLEEELTHLTNSYGQLRAAEGKFRGCIESVKEIKPENKQKTILVPLTNSLYVPGKLRDTEHVIVDVGTGYYVKKTRAQATKYYQTKVDFVRTNLDALQETITRRQDNLQQLGAVLQSKIQEQVQQQQTGGGAKAKKK